MKQTAITISTDKQRYLSPALQVIRLDAAPVLTSVSGTGVYNLGYGGDGDGEEGD